MAYNCPTNMMNQPYGLNSMGSQQVPYSPWGSGGGGGSCGGNSGGGFGYSPDMFNSSFGSNMGYGYGSSPYGQGNSSRMDFSNYWYHPKGFLVGPVRFGTDQSYGYGSSYNGFSQSPTVYGGYY
jgi:hypothetical protein